jgi:hypothetical protein
VLNNTNRDYAGIIFMRAMPRYQTKLGPADPWPCRDRKVLLRAVKSPPLR